MERSVYRIIDANFNRAREAARVIEDFCRFSLNSSQLSGEAKQLRHELSGQIKQLNAGLLISSRDTITDVGVGQEVANQLKRTDIEDSFSAACKRLTEALRVLSEFMVPISPAGSQKVEQLRYRAYTLEKDITIFKDMRKKFSRVRLYVLISSEDDKEIASLTDSCIKGGADCIQLRAKNITDDRTFALAEKFTAQCRAGGVLSIINDQADIAIASAADGVHLGQNDLPIKEVRKLQLSPLITGKSTHSPDQLIEACKENPTYTALGPIFATTTKPGAKAVGLEYLRQAIEILADTGITGVAIGAINIDNVDEVLKAGAKVIAVCSAVTKATDPESVCRILKQKIIGSTRS